MNNITGNRNKKRNIKMILEYDGSGYAGWQRLGAVAKKRPIQSVVEECLSSCLGQNIKVIGSGRTDAGVHALGQAANFHCETEFSFSELLQELNKRLPEDIRVLRLNEADMDFHSRYSAKGKTYEYRIAQGEVQPVFTRKYTLHVPEPLDLTAMKKASEYLLGTHDFKAFSTDRKDGKSTVRTIDGIQIVKINPLHNKPYEEIRIAITGDGFLYNMVRIIIGTLIETGKGIRRPEDMVKVLESKDRQQAGITVSSQGLCLLNVRY